MKPRKAKPVSEIVSRCLCCHGVNGKHDDWCTPDVRADVRDIVAGDLSDGAYLAMSDEFDIEP